MSTHATTSEVNVAVARARQAWPKWAALSIDERVARIEHVGEVIAQNGRSFAERIAADTGKPVVEALMTELVSVPLFIRYYARIAKRTLRSRRVTTPLVFLPRRSRVDHIPFGVIAVIAPWNFPFQLAIVPVLSALLAGNTVVVKPSEITPQVSLLLAEVFQRAGLTDGIVEVLHGDGATGAALCEAAVDKIFFTGSPATGRRVMAAAAERLIPVELELGGKDPMIVLPDAPLERAAHAAVWGGLLNAGQMCISVERILVHTDVYERFVELLLAEVARIRVGNPDEDADMGPMTSPAQLPIVERHVRAAIDEGATVACGGNRIDRAGLFFEPTVLLDVTPSMVVWREETFGPVLPVMRFSSEDEAVRLANNNAYGLTASVWTRSARSGQRVAAQIRAGHVNINDLVASVGNPALPFGGVGRSGFGRYHGPEGLLAFCQSRAISHHPPFPARDPFWYPYGGKLPAALTVFDGLTQGRLFTAVVGLIRLARTPRPDSKP
jgi:acyl-CoA reductase-like NAD-dependent aldehyde dehydrogenase